MKISAEMIRAALANHHREPRTHGAKIMDALAHVRLSLAHKKAGPCEHGLKIHSVMNENERTQYKPPAP